MLLKSWRKEVIHPVCRPEAESVQCIAHLDQDIEEVIPYLNAVLGGFRCTREPPSVSFRAQGKLIAVHGRKLCVNALRDEAEGDKILEWLKQEINDAWERRAAIRPSFESAPQPKMLDILRLLPRTNCGQCGQPTCMVFSALAAEGGKGAVDCPPLSPEAGAKLDAYLARFHFE